MMHILAIIVLLLVFVLVVLVAYVAPEADRRFNRVSLAPPYAVSDAALELHERLLVADLHCDFLLWKRDLLKRYERGHVDLPRLVEGGTALQVFSVVTKSPWGQNYERTAGSSDRITLLAMAQGWPVGTWRSQKQRALHQAARLHRFARRSGGGLIIIQTREDLDRFQALRAQNRKITAGLLAMEGLHPLEGKLANIDLFFEAGFRMMAPVHMFDNDVAGSASGVEQYGLTELGRQAVTRMEELGVLIDLAHASPRTIDDVLEMATRPVVVSHAGVRATCNSPRNLTENQLRRVADGGGLIGIGFWDQAVCGTTVDDIVRAIRHVVDLVGADHVALGSDFDGTVKTAFDASGMAILTQALLESGFIEGDIRKIMGGNAFRLLRETLPPG